MAVFSATRRLFGLPAWLWLVLPVPILALASWLAFASATGPFGSVSTSLSEPPEKSEVLRRPLLVTRQGDSFRFVPIEEQKGVKPLWVFGAITTENYKVQWQSHGFFPGLIHRRSRWTYELSATRFDPDWRDDKKDLLTLPAEEIRRLRPLVVAELNRRDPAAKRGDRLEHLLDNGLEASSSMCLQNALIVLSWLSVPMALVGVCSMFVPTRKKATGPEATDFGR